MPSKCQRISSHKIETLSRDNVRSIIDTTGEALFRDITERDYGIDAIVELFEHGHVTGKFALLQIKSTSNKIIPLKNSNEISCKITSSNAQYAFQKNIPVILIYISLAEKHNFFYTDLQNSITREHIRKLESGQEEITVRIPLENRIQINHQLFFKIINSFY